MRSAVRKASLIIGTAVIFLLATRGFSAQSATASPVLSCASSLEKGKDLLGRRQFHQAEELLARSAEKCPDMGDLFDTLGLAYDLDGHPARAQAAHRTAISISPRNAGFHNNLAASLLRSGDESAAVVEFQKALAIDPANKVANLNLGSVYLKTRQFEPAFRCLLAAHVERSQDPVALLELTEAYFGAGDTRAARETANRLAKIPGLSSAVRFSLGLELAAHGEYEPAAQQFAAIPPSDRDLAADLNLGMAYSKTRRFREAREAYDTTLRLDPSNPDAFLHIGLDAAAQGDRGAAIDWITQAHMKAPDRPDISCALAQELVRARNFERARDLLASALADHPDEPNLREAQGDLLLEEGRPDEAAKAYLQVLGSEPQRTEARVSLALAYQQLRQNDKATSELEQVLRIDPGNAAAQAQLGHLALNSGQQDTAIRWINQALATDPENLTANEDMAVLLERADKPDRARVILERLAKLDPTNPRIHYLLSHVLAQLRKPEEAKAEFELSKKLQAPQNRHSE